MPYYNSMVKIDLIGERVHILIMFNHNNIMRIHQEMVLMFILLLYFQKNINRLEHLISQELIEVI